MKMETLDFRVMKKMTLFYNFDFERSDDYGIKRKTFKHWLFY